MNLTNWLSSPVTEALGWTLLHALWQGFVLVAIVAVLLHLYRQGRASFRYQLGMGGLLCQALLSVGTFCWYYHPDLPAGAGLVPASFTGPGTLTVVTVPAPASGLAALQTFLTGHLAEVVWVWLAGVILFGLRLLGGWLYVQRICTSAKGPVPAVLKEVSARLEPKINVSARLRVSAQVAGPLVVGVLKPLVLWPVGLLAQLSMAEVEAVLAHEMAHIRRHDYLFNLLQSAMDVFYFFHPALWWLSARIREEREHCCDDIAVAITGDARTLARALARVEAWQRTEHANPLLTIAFAGKRQLLLQRVRRVLGMPTQAQASNGSLAGLALVSLLLLSVSVYAVQQKPAQNKNEQQEPGPINQQPTGAKPSRQYRVDKSTEFGTTDKQKLTYVIWRGKKLPASLVTRLQAQLDRVKNGQLSLDVVQQPDRDILLTLIEAEAIASATENLAPPKEIGGMAVLALETPVHTSTAPTHPAMPAEATTVSIRGKLAPALSPDSLARLRAGRTRQLDSLSRLMNQQQAQMEALQRQMEKEQFAVEALERQQETLNWKRESLMRQRQKWLEKHQQLVSGNKPKPGQPVDVEKLIAENEAKIRESEQAVGGVLKQLEVLQPGLEKARQPLRELERQLEQLDQMAEELGEQMNRETRTFEQMAEREMSADMRRYERENRDELRKGTRTIRPARPALLPPPPRPAAPARSGKPGLPPPPALDPALAPGAPRPPRMMKPGHTATSPTPPPAPHAPDAVDRK